MTATRIASAAALTDAAAASAASSPAAATPRAIPALDGLRALAVTLVFLAHSGLEGVLPGGLGVTVFFVISGFLITTLMRVEHARSGALDWRAFYLRRFWRLMPPLVVVLGAGWWLSTPTGPAPAWIGGHYSARGAAAALAYLGNYQLIVDDFNGVPAGLGVIWSLAIEEHFYLAFPPLALLLLRWRAQGRLGAIHRLLGALCAAVLLWRIWLASHGASVNYLTMATDTRADAILVGAWLALVRNPWLDGAADGAVPGASRFDATAATAFWRTRLGLSPRVQLGAACVAVLLLSVALREPLFRLTLRFTLQAGAAAGLIALAVGGSLNPAHAAHWRWLGARPLVYLGTVSYTLYLVHHIVLLGLARQSPGRSWWAQTLLAALISLACAEAMRRAVEQPCARLSRRWRAGRAIQPAPIAVPAHPQRQPVTP